MDDSDGSDGSDGSQSIIMQRLHENDSDRGVSPETIPSSQRSPLGVLPFTPRYDSDSNTISYSNDSNYSDRVPSLVTVPSSQRSGLSIPPAYPQVEPRPPSYQSQVPAAAGPAPRSSPPSYPGRPQGILAQSPDNASPPLLNSPAVSAEIWGDALEESQRIQTCFEQHRSSLRRFTFEGVLGQGFSGLVCKIKLRHGVWPRRVTHRYAIKRSIRPNENQAAILNEIALLRRLRGALHIVQPFVLRSRIRDPLGAMEGRTVMMELLKNGSLEQFLTRLGPEDPQLPNRLLLRLFLCLVRACIAMAWPPNRQRDNRVRKERIPNEQNRPPMHQLRHGDMHEANLLFGDWDNDEHRVLPVLKLIDFGGAQVFPAPQNQNLGVKWNLFDIGLVMRTLITRDRNHAPPRSMTLVSDDGINGNILSHGGDLSPPNFPHLDDDIRYLVIRLLAANPQERPELERTYNRIKYWVDNRRSYHYANFPLGSQHETDANIREIFQHSVLNGPVN